MSVYEPSDKLLLTIDPLISTTKARPHIRHTITLLDPVAGISHSNDLPRGHFVNYTCAHYSLNSEVTLTAIEEYLCQ